MQSIAIAILIAVACSGALDLYLKRRQALAVAANRDSVPADFSQSVTLAEHQRAADYNSAAIRLGAIESAFDTIVSMVWLTALLAPLYGAVAALVPAGLSRSVVLILVIGATGAALHLLFSLVRTFGIEARFGINRTGAKMFAADRAKGLALQLGFAIPLLYGFFWLLATAPRLWWVIGWAGAVGLAIALTLIYPTMIAPLFNRFTALPAGPMRSRIEDLLCRCGFEANGLFVMDASKRSSHGNAYFSGFGKAKRIVFFDTLLEKHTADEILAILAHELGHFKLGHIGQRLAQSAAFMLIFFAALAWAFSGGGVARQFGLADDPGVALAIVMIAAGPVLHLAAPLTNALSRRAEFEADAFAAAAVGREPMIGALTRLSRDNLSTLTPDGLYVLFYYSHPPVPVRIAELRTA